MAPLPKRRHSTRRSRLREEKLKVKFTNLSKCPKCKAARQSHRACPKCGLYKNEKTR